MTKLLLPAFLLLALIELWLIIQVGAVLGAFATLALMLFTAVLGISLVRSQGLKTLLAAQQRLAQGQAPAGEMLQGLLLAVAGGLLILPGFFTDLLGLLLLQPTLRRHLIARWLKAVPGFAPAASPFASPANDATGSGQVERDGRAASQGTTVDGEYERKDR
ncbi:FxsA family protein [Pseudaeromonas paramecii]|uniref:Membrane protein FxsA n=1 Tax=Pseudaeromonas paramecii TaxID=2138166 RepID=A0ABP8QC84_9GAMM